MSTEASSWERAAQALRLLAFDPDGLGGAVIRMRASPARDQMVGLLSGLDLRKLPPTIGDEQLLGGVDLAATLNASQVVRNKAFFDRQTHALLTMAERCPTELAAKLAQQLDTGNACAIVALDEGADPDEHCPAALSERLAFFIAPEGRMPKAWPPPQAPRTTVQLDDVYVSEASIEKLTSLAAVFGIHSLRAPQLALRAAKANAALSGRAAVEDDDISAAAELVYPHRATRVPESAEEPEPDTSNPDASPPDDEVAAQDGLSLPDGDMLIDAVRALLPNDILAGLVAQGTSRASSGAGAGQRHKGNRRGRPLPSRPGRLDGSSRIDLVATLRAAAPWQPMRRKAVPQKPGLHIRPADIRLKRYEEKSDRLLIFAVDASGSAAIARLNEAKGAVEMLLAQAYAARDHVALIAFRGTGAEILLPPTRSLVQTKRRLASLPGGGGTPLAAGLQHAALLAEQNRARGLTPTVVILTDGRANIALDGQPDRAVAQADAEKMARMLGAQGISALVIDMSNRPQDALRGLAQNLNARYIALPRADAVRLSSAVSAALEA
ncbi:MAG: magnesium chelatase subunit D [Pseudomonadota bacterium]